MKHMLGVIAALVVIVIAPSSCQSPTASTQPAQPVTTTSVTPFESQASLPITLTVVYDHRSFDARLKTAWGFACLIETSAETILFDTGSDGPTLMYNLTQLGVDPNAIDAVVISHAHNDHTGGLDQLLAVNDHLVVYAANSLSPIFTARIHNPVIDTMEARQIADGVRTTGGLSGAATEQSLIIETRLGQIVLTGCAHPGIVEIVRQAKTYGNVHLVVGGFHIGDASDVIPKFKDLDVEQVAPSHCTGDLAVEQFSKELGENFVSVGAGTVIHVKD